MLMLDRCVRLIVPFGITLIVFNPIAVMLSLQFSSVYYVMLIAMLVMLKRWQCFRFCNELFEYLFLTSGICTSYLDFLTYPAVTLGIPLVVLLIINEEASFFAKCKGIAKASLSWGVGYCCMWSGKWLVSSILLKQNMFSDAVSNILFRTSMEMDGEPIAWLEVALKNVRVLAKWPYLIMFAMVLCFVLIAVRRYGINSGANKVYRGIPFLIVILIPFVWYFILGNHSYEHYWFTFRELGIACFALFAYIFGIPQRFFGERKLQTDKE